MQVKTLEARVREVSGIAIIDLRGEIDLLAEDELQAAYQTAAGTNPRAILLNFSDVGYINSTGIALIVGLLGQARRSETSLVACGLSEHYTEIFRITRLSDFITTYSDETAALADLANT